MKAALIVMALILLSGVRAANPPGSGPVPPPNTYSDTSSVQLFSFGSKEHPITTDPAPIQDPSATYAGPPIQGRLSPEAQRNVGIQMGFSEFGIYDLPFQKGDKGRGG